MPNTQGLETMQKALAQVASLAESADEDVRFFISNELRKLSLKLEGQKDTLYRIGYSQLELSVMKIAADLKLFHILSEAKEPMTTQQLSAKTTCSPILMGRILRFLDSYSAVEETDKNTFRANKISHVLAQPGGHGMIYHLHDIMGPAVLAMPDFYKNKGWNEIVDNVNCPFQKGHATPLPAFAWIMQRPDLMAHFNNFMVAKDEHAHNWRDSYPMERLTSNLSPEQVFFVDVAGGLGHQCKALIDTLGGKPPGKVILQDLPEVIGMALDTPGVKNMIQDIFQPQKIKGARAYYMHNVAHDWPDDKVIEILGNLKTAMNPDSLVLIDEICTPNTNVHKQITGQDMMMMAGAGARERTKDEWLDVITKAGFKINSTYTYSDILQESLMEIVPI